MTSAGHQAALKRGICHVTDICSDHRKPLLKFAALLGVIACGTILLTAFNGVPDADAFRKWMHADSIWSIFLFVPVAIALQSSFVPNPALAAIAGVLYGSVLGIPAAIIATVAAAGIQVFIGRRILGEHMRQDLAKRFKRIDRHIERDGWIAVMYARILPGPTTLIHYAAGGTRVSLKHVLFGNLLGASPKTAAYVVLGGSLDDLTSLPVYIALAVIAVFATAGAAIARKRLGEESDQ